MKKKINIHIGDYYASREPVIIYTLLGSCVAVCLYDRKNKIGGMNHILLPGEPDLNNFDTSARYGINAMELLINRIMTLGGNRHEIVAKVFGGGHIIVAISKDLSVGPRIIKFVKAFLNNEGIKIVSHNCGGDKARKIFFHTDSGNVFLKHISPKMYPDILINERRMSKNITMKLKKPGKIELFQ